MTHKVRTNFISYKTVKTRNKQTNKQLHKQNTNWNTNLCTTLNIKYSVSTSLVNTVEVKTMHLPTDFNIELVL